MGTRTAVVITCDEPGCDEEYVGHGHEDEDTARYAANGNHWRQRRVVEGRRVKWIDLCPDHKDDGEGR